MRGGLVLLTAASLVVAGCGDGDTTSEAAFTIETEPHSPADPVAGFSATGDAVEEGMLCADGVATWLRTLHADTGLPESPENPPSDGEVLWVEFEITCGDGTGEFVLRADVTVDFAEHDAVIADAEISSGDPLSLIDGDGNYADVGIDGVRQWSVATPGDIEGGYYDVFTGTVTRG